MRILLMTVLHIHVVTVQAAYYIEDFSKGISWKNANSNCTLATPDLIYTAEGITIANAHISDILGKGDKVWLGYVKVFQLFQYIGCINVSKLKITPTAHIVPSDPGLCYSACTENAYFGIGNAPSKQKEGKCYCLGDLFVSQFGSATGQQCNNSCVFPNGTACGGEGLVSLYQHVAKELLSTVKEKKRSLVSTVIHDLLEEQNTGDNQNLCVVYHPYTDFKYSWTSCKATHQTMCDTVPKSVTKVVGLNSDWLGVSNICFSKGQYPVSYKGDLTISKNITEAPLWTGILRSGIVLQNSESGFIASSAGIFGYMDVGNKGKLRVMFTADSLELHSKSLCYTDTPKTETSSVGVYVGVLVAIVVLVALGALAFFIWRKRKHTLTQNDDDRNNMAAHSKGACNDIPIAYSDLEVSVRTNNPDLNKSHGYDRIQSINKKKENEIKDTYDTTTTAVKSVPIKETENVYNRLNANTDNTYDNINTGPYSKQPIVSSSTSGDNTYDTSNNKTGHGNATLATDDYSHVNVAANIKKQPDNVYAKANLARDDRKVDKGGQKETDTTYDR